MATIKDKDKNEDVKLEATPEADTSSEENSETTPDQSKWFVPGKWETPDNMKTSYNELEKWKGEAVERIDKLDTYVNQSTALLNAVYSDPDIQKLVTQKYGDKQQEEGVAPVNTPTDKPNTETPAETPRDPRVDQMESTMRVAAVQDFDRKIGIIDKSQKEKDDIHAIMGREINTLGYDVRTAPVDMLPALLDKSYRLTHPDQATEAARVRGATETMGNLQSSLPSQGGGTGTPGEAPVALSDEQKKWAKNLGVKEGKIQETLKKETKK